nr:MAG TPA: hypothetical protein [Siphoviridae sp. ctX8T1]
MRWLPYFDFITATKTFEFNRCPTPLTLPRSVI